MTDLPPDDHSDYRIISIVFILSEHVAQYEYMPYGRILAKIGNSKWPPVVGCFSMKTKQIYIWSEFCKHGGILLKLSMQVSMYRVQYNRKEMESLEIQIWVEIL